MKTTQLSIILLFALLFHSNLFGQTFEVPTDYAFQTKADFAKYEPQVIQAVTWLEATPLNQDADKRKLVNAFLFKYLEGSPTISIELKSYVIPLTKKNPDLMIAFMGGWAKYKLQNPTLIDVVKLNTAGVRTVIQIYKLGGAVKEKDIEKLIKLTSDQELEE